MITRAVNIIGPGYTIKRGTRGLNSHHGANMHVVFFPFYSNLNDGDAENIFLFSLCSIKIVSQCMTYWLYIVFHICSSQLYIDCCGNDIRLHQSEVTKVNVESVCAFAKTMSDSVVFSGPRPNLTSDDMFSHMSSFKSTNKRWSWVQTVSVVEHLLTQNGSINSKFSIILQ